MSAFVVVVFLLLCLCCFSVVLVRLLCVSDEWLSWVLFVLVIVLLLFTLVLLKQAPRRAIVIFDFVADVKVHCGKSSRMQDKKDLGQTTAKERRVLDAYQGVLDP